jgi:hypothetical protein
MKSHRFAFHELFGGMARKYAFNISSISGLANVHTFDANCLLSPHFLRFAESRKVESRVTRPSMGLATPGNPIFRRQRRLQSSPWPQVAEDQDGCELHGLARQLSGEAYLRIHDRCHLLSFEHTTARSCR